MQIYLDSVGCRLNWSEIEMLARQLRAGGHTIVTGPEEADIVIVNTCAVTAQAERKTRHTIRSLHRDNPDVRLAVIGCYATLRPDVSAGFAGVSWVIANPEKDRTVQRISEATSWRSNGLWQEIEAGAEMLRTRAFVKVQDGCDNHCTYCIIRSLRGPSRSRPLGDIIAEIQMLTEEADCREVVLTGASLGGYGSTQSPMSTQSPGSTDSAYSRDLAAPRRASGPASQRASDRDRSNSLGRPNFVGLGTLIETILAETDIARLRLSSLEPWDIGDATHPPETFFELWDDPRLCRQIHLPLQAGCDATLRRMGRPITKEAFAHLVETARAMIPDVAVTTDVLVGFPGEDEEAFRESYEFVKRMAFAKLHVFPYSPRPGTPATRLPEQVPRHVRDARAEQMRKLGAEQRHRFQARFLDRELAVLWEKQWQDGRWTGWTDNYIRVVARAEENWECLSLGNTITKARLLTLKKGYVEGEVVL